MRFSAFFGWLGLCLVPLLVCLDEATAVAAGWSPRCAGGFRILPWAAGLALMAAALSLVFAPMRSFYAVNRRRFWLASAAVLGTLGSLELLLGIVDPGPGFHQRLAGEVFSYDPDPFALPGVIGRAKSSINSEGIRGSEPHNPRDHRSLLCIGGGATECCYIDDAECWTELLGKQLDRNLNAKIWTGSVGYSEYCTGEHLRFVRSSSAVDVVDEVVLLVGANDLTRTLLGLGTTGAAPPFWIQSRPVATARRWWNVNMQRGFVIDATGGVLTRCRRERTIEPRGDVDWDVEIEAYAERCRSIALAAKAKRKKVTFIAQPVLWSGEISPYVARRMWLARSEPPREWDQLRADKLRALVDRYHRALEGAAKEEGVRFIDASAMMSGEAVYFYDDFHLSEDGNRRLAEIVAESLVNGRAP